MTGNTALSGKKLAFVEALGDGAKIPEAAEKAGISPRTAWRWMKLPEIILALQDVQQGALQSALRRLTGKADRAIDVYSELLDAVDDVTRFRAAQGILNLVLQYLDKLDLAARLEEIKAELREEMQAAAGRSGY